MYSESSSSLTVQLHSRSRLLTLLLIRRLSIFSMRLCVDHGEEREAPWMHARTRARTTLMSGHVNDLCVLGSNTRSETGWPAAVRSGSASSLTGRLASFWRGGEITLPLRSLSLSLSLVRLDCHPPPPTTPYSPRLLAVAMPLQCCWAG